MSTLREAAEEALRWMEHARLHLTIKERMHPDGLGLYDNAAEALRAALAQPEAEAEPVAWQVKKGGSSMSELREAAQAALNQWDKVSGVFRMTAETEALRAALAQPETESVAWIYDWYSDGEVVGDWITQDRDEAHSPSMGCHNIRPLYANPPRDEWRPASEPPEDGRDVVVWCAQERRAVHGMYVRRHPPVVGLVDGWVAPDASKLTHWRDVTPPTEGAK